MQVLIADFDLFRTVGGGQTFYRAIIEKNPQIDFSYLIVNEPADAARPANTRGIRYEQTYLEGEWNHYCDLVPPRWCMPAFLMASNIAASVRGRSFDVVDLPDYQQFGYYLPAALTHHQVEARRIALSMHGVISTTVSLNWGSDGVLPRVLVAQEEMQYKSVDLRYGLSAAYLEEWQNRVALPSQYLSPLEFLDLPRPSHSVPSASPPDLNFVGRTEKRKGPDVFAELAWWLPPQSYGHARIIGPPSHDPLGISSDEHLRRMLHYRSGQKAIELLPSATPDELRQLFADRGITVLPSRYDTFNLVAIESLFSGCPTAIGSGAGVCRFLDETFPGVPYLKIDMDRPLNSLPAMESVLGDYDRYRQRLIDAIAAARPRDIGLPLAEIYATPPARDEEVRREAAAWYDRLMGHRQRPVTPWQNTKESARRLVRKHTTPAFRARVRSLRHRPSAAAWIAHIEQKLLATPLRHRVAARRLHERSSAIAERCRAVAWMPERTQADLTNKWRQCAQLIADVRIDRVRLWRELARIETLRGNDLVAATYRLRAIRLVGEDRFRDLPAVLRTLTENGYHREAETARAMYAATNSERLCRELLDGALEKHRQAADAPYERVDDRRDAAGYRVSVIVSLYNAAENLPRFLEAMSLQTLLRAKQAELVLIDSGSPSDEYRVFRQWVNEAGLPAVYARSARRETIQAAWNRGIGLARGHYLSFLGVDETILPPALEILAAELDADPQTDWVQANSLLTKVNEHGHWNGDIMTYDRTGYAQRLVYLETCYLSYVGAMYRRNLHQRVGYYDASFGAAGDTEFKNRVLPFIKSKAIAQTLGVFWNYPAGQTTCSPRAEIEDLRAWYLHRTPAGIRYALQAANQSETESLLLDALGYRKSYCGHTSTDLDYASHVSNYLAQTFSHSKLSVLREGIDRLLQSYRELDCLPDASPQSIAQAIEHARLVAEQVGDEHRQSRGAKRAEYDVFHDNRHEQHHFIWPTEQSAGSDQTARAA